jgi:hypothetical protein
LIQNRIVGVLEGKFPEIVEGQAEKLAPDDPCT